MNFPSPLKVSEIAELLKAECFGSIDLEIFGLNEIHRIKKNELAFVDHPKYYDTALNSDASCIIINQKVDVPKGKAIIVSSNPFGDFNFLIDKFYQFVPSKLAIADTAEIGKGTILQPNVFIGENVTIGQNCVIHAGVIINNNCQIGNKVIIHPNTVIGGEAFYYKKQNGTYERLKSCGRVIIKNNVEIGANTTIDRGVTSDTIIGEGTKIDNLVQIGHDTEIGENCLIASQTGVAGCVTIKNNVTLWGQVGISSGLTLNEGSVVYAQSGVGRDLDENTSYFGSPADVAKVKMKELAALKRLPELLNKKG
jgi:UDP-3-O-[3-hydroxymyristoyl] glucosamine N-acyltransferase